MAFVGITRFSLFDPSSAAWVTTKAEELQDEEKLLSFLYSDERIAPRLEIFINYSLPQIISASQKHNIRHIIQYSVEMPDKYQQRLKDLAAEHECIVLDPHIRGRASVDPDDIGLEISNESAVFGVYRLDDDDLLSEDFFDQTSKYVNESFLGMRISLARGVTGIFSQGQYSYLRACYQPYIAIGLMGICGRDRQGNFVKPPDCSHHHSDRYGSVVVNAEKPSFFWTRHVGQDTAHGKDSAYEGLIRELSNYESIPSSWNIAKVFPTIADRIPRISYTNFASGLTVESNGIWFDVDEDKVGNKFSVKVVARFGEKIPAISALLKFDIVDLNDNKLQATDVRLDGFGSSGYEDIGFFRYLRTEPGNQEIEENFYIPEGLKVKRIGIQPFGKGAKPFELAWLSFGIE